MIITKINCCFIACLYGCQRCTSESTCTQCTTNHFLVDYSGIIPFCTKDRCPPGMISNTFSICSACPAGTYNDGTSLAPLSTCQNCPAGLYNSLINQTHCIACSKGRYLKTEAATSNTQCTPCPAGTYGNNEGRNTDCAPCPEGTFNLVIGQEICLSKKKIFFINARKLNLVIKTFFRYIKILIVIYSLP